MKVSLEGRCLGTVPLEGALRRSHIKVSWEGRCLGMVLVNSQLIASHLAGPHTKWPPT